jgi:excisionase family DNA binding protein
MTNENQKQTSAPARLERVTFKIAEAAKILGISTSTVRRLIASGKIRVLRALRHPLIPAAEVEKFIKL